MDIEDWDNILIKFIFLSYFLAFLTDIVMYLVSMYSPPGENHIYLISTILWGFSRMYTPTIATIILVSKMGYRFIDVLREYLNFDFGLLKWYLLSPMIVYLSVLVYILIGYPLGYIDISNIFTYTSGDGIEFTPMQVVLLLLISSYTASISVNALFAFGEEVGWRGFLFNLLEPHYSILKMSVIIGMVWGFWHLSAIVLLGYIRQYSNLYELLTTIFFYVLWVVVISVSHVYLRYISNSILPSISLHGGVNALWNITLLISTESLPFELGSLGIVGIISWIIVSIPIVLYSYFIGIMDKSR